MFSDQILDQNFTEGQMVSILESMSQQERIVYYNYLNPQSLIQKSILTRFLYNLNIPTDMGHYEILARKHPALNPLRFSNNSFKLKHKHSLFERTAMTCENDAYLISTYRDRANPNKIKLGISNNLVVPSAEIFQTSQNYPDFKPTITKRQQAVLVRGIAVSRIDSFSLRNHTNRFDCYSDSYERNLARKYFTHRGSLEIPTPHFHFNTLNQSAFQYSQYSANAIHIDELLAYIYDVANSYEKFKTELTNNPTQKSPVPAILRYDLGMPFLKIAKGEMIIQNKTIKDFMKAMNDKNISDMMKDLSYLKIPEGESSSSGIETLDAIFDCLMFYRDFLQLNPDDIEGIKYLTQCVNTIINSSPVASNENNMDLNLDM